MANYEPNKTDPLWFLDDEENLNKNTSTENGNSNRDSEDDIFTLTDLGNNDFLEQMNDYNSAESLKNETSNENGTQEKAVEDVISLKSELENSLFDLAKESVDKGKAPEFRITISSNDEGKSEDKDKNDDFSSLLFDNDGSSLKDEQNEKSNLTSEGNNLTFGAEKTSDILSDNSIEDKLKPKIYVIVKSNKNGGSALQSSANQTCSEIGSAVINLNDFISPQSKITGNENITTSVNLLNSDGDKQKVELVVTIKDERNKPTQEPARLKQYRNEVNTDFPNLETLLSNEFLDSKIKQLSDKIQKLSSAMSMLNPNASSRLEGRYPRGDWTESKDSYIRESDGARCYRTVTKTHNGRRVQTQCYKGGSRVLQRCEGWVDTSSLNDVRNEISRAFSRFNRLAFL